MNRKLIFVTHVTILIRIIETKIMDNKIARVFAQFRRFDQALIDASSIIYIHKSEFLPELAEMLTLFTIPEIVIETGYGNLPVHLIRKKMDGNTTDQRFIFCAKWKRIPVISEDKKILLEIKKNEIPYFNALMMLNFLLFGGRINKERHSFYFKKLREIAWYSDKIYEFSKAVFKAIDEKSQRKNCRSLH